MPSWHVQGQLCLWEHAVSVSSSHEAYLSSLNATSPNEDISIHFFFFSQFKHISACCHFWWCFLLPVTNVPYFLLIVAFIWNVTATYSIFCCREFEFKFVIKDLQMMCWNTCCVLSGRYAEQTVLAFINMCHVCSHSYFDLVLFLGHSAPASQCAWVAHVSMIKVIWMRW